MIRYQHLSIKNMQSQAEKLWNEIEIVCESKKTDYKYEPVKKSDLGPIARIEVSKSNLIPSIIILAALVKNNEWEKIYVANIIPSKPSSDRLSMEEYNDILSAFKFDVMDKAVLITPNVEIKYNSAEYSIEDCIPESYHHFERWMNGHPLSYHQNDMDNWYRFVSELYINGEELGLDDFENCLTQDYRWSQEDAEDFSSRLSDELDLLKVYDSVR